MTSSQPTHHKPAELFRSDLISAMKLPDSTPLEQGSFLTIREPWRTEWEFGVQVCVSPGQFPEPQSSLVKDPPERTDHFELPANKLTSEGSSSEYPVYDLDEMDISWLATVNQKRTFRALAGLNGLTEDTLRNGLVTLETKCQQNLARAVATEQDLGIEYDEHTVCDVCQDTEGEEANDIIFCDMCNVCVHQACYGVASVPKGSWLCKVCTSGEEAPDCALCYSKGGALKRVRPGNTSWAHISCALWIPEVRLGNAEKMEPITNIEAVPMSRWNLTCCLCKRKQGACIQCCHPSCVVAYHVTCAFRHGLIMKSRLVNTTVIQESFCPKHSAMRRSPPFSPLKHGPRIHPTALMQLQENFFKYASVNDLTSSDMSPKLAALIYNYWKLKRRSNYNRTLLSHLPIETSLESVRAELARGGARYSLRDNKDFMKIVHIRQNLEKARNLIYMVQRRERLKKQLLYNQSSHWDMKVQSMDHPSPSETECQESDSAGRLTRSMAQTSADEQSHTDTHDHIPTVTAIPNGPSDPPTHTCTHSSLNTRPNLDHTPSNHGNTNHKPNCENSIDPPNEPDPLTDCVVHFARTGSKLTNGGHSLNGLVPEPSSKVKGHEDPPKVRGHIDSLVMKSGRGPNLRHRPYTVDRTTTELS